MSEDPPRQQEPLAPFEDAPWRAERLPSGTAAGGQGAGGGEGGGGGRERSLDRDFEDDPDLADLGAADRDEEPSPLEIEDLLTVDLDAAIPEAQASAAERAERAVEGGGGGGPGGGGR